MGKKYKLETGTITLNFRVFDCDDNDTGEVEQGEIDILGLVKSLAKSRCDTIDTTAIDVNETESTKPAKPRKKHERRYYNIQGKTMDTYEVGDILHPNLPTRIQRYRAVSGVLERHYKDPETGEYDTKGFEKYLNKEVRKAQNIASANNGNAKVILR